MHREKGSRRIAAGFTLMEIMIVLAIILSLFGFLIGPRVYKAYRESQKKDTEINMGIVNGAVIQYQASHSGQCPSGIDDLKSAGLIDKTKDEWGEDLILTCPGSVNTDSFDLVSKGPDRKLGTPDDIVFGAESAGQ